LSQSLHFTLSLLLASTRTPYFHPTSSEFLLRTFAPSVTVAGSASVVDIRNSEFKQSAIHLDFRVHANTDTYMQPTNDSVKQKRSRLQSSDSVNQIHTVIYMQPTNYKYIHVIQIQSSMSFRFTDFRLQSTSKLTEERSKEQRRGAWEDIQTLGLGASA